MNYILASREAIANMVEIHASVIPWDGMVLLSSCDKSVPAHLIAAARLDIPTVHVPGGSQRGAPNMTTSGYAGTIFAKWKKGEIPIQEVKTFQRSGCPTYGACQFMGTASMMQCVSEALGMALPDSAIATLSEIRRIARAAGHQVMSLAEKSITARKILTRAAFDNAIKIHAAIGGSTNALIHLLAAISLVRTTLDIEGKLTFDEASKKIATANEISNEFNGG
jgi:dihydroxy-acid dehydratase